MTFTPELADVLATSRRATPRSRRERRCACRGCGRRPALFRRWTHRLQVRADRHHDLCFACFRAARDAQRCRMLAEARTR